MRVAAFQAPLEATSSMSVIEHIRSSVRACEEHEVDILCCPEAVIGGLADYCDDPSRIAIDTEDGHLHRVLAPLRSDTVATIVGFTERDVDGRLYNSAAVLHCASVVGIYRKRHPARRRSIYHAGGAAPVFTIGRLRFGVLLCRDSTFPEPARTMVASGATVLFIPTNNGLPPGTAGPELVEETRAQDAAMAKAYGVSVVRADIAGRADALMAYGTSTIVDARGVILRSAAPYTSELLIADIEPGVRVVRPESCRSASCLPS